MNNGGNSGIYGIYIEVNTSQRESGYVHSECNECNECNECVIRWRFVIFQYRWSLISRYRGQDGVPSSARARSLSLSDLSYTSLLQFLKIRNQFSYLLSHTQSAGTPIL